MLLLGERLVEGGGGERDRVLPPPFVWEDEVVLLEMLDR